MAAKQPSSQADEGSLLLNATTLNSTIDEAIGVLAVTMDEKFKMKHTHWKSLNVGIAPFLDEAMKSRELQDELAVEKARRKVAEKQSQALEQHLLALKRRVAQLEDNLTHNGITPPPVFPDSPAKTKRKKKDSITARPVSAPLGPKETMKTFAARKLVTPPTP